MHHFVGSFNTLFFIRHLNDEKQLNFIYIRLPIKSQHIYQLCHRLTIRTNLLWWFRCRFFTLIIKFYTFESNYITQSCVNVAIKRNINFWFAFLCRCSLFAAFIWTVNKCEFDVKFASYSWVINLIEAGSILPT